MQRPKTLVTLSSITMLLTAALSGQTLPVDTAAPLRLTAVAINMSNMGTGQTSPVSIVINNWTTDPVRDSMLNTVIEKGPEALLSELQKAPSVGRISVPGSLGYDLHYARRAPFGDGGAQIVLATDRPISGWELMNRPRVSDYPFTLIQIHLNSAGQGEGKFSIATKIGYDRTTKSIQLETFASEPVRLERVHIESAAPVR